MPNRLAKETSPYLLQHKDNPIDWYPWGDEAFARANAEAKPVFLSVGYSSCHWCHVMAHESFEDGEVAQLLNESFVSVKVDREERPDVDDAYMAAVHLSNGRGGWPMTVFLTPDRKPFYAGTYFPKNDRGGMPGLISILRQVTGAWAERRGEVASVAGEYMRALGQLLGRRPPEAQARSWEERLRAAATAILADADLEHGGFGTKPKFPPHTGIEFLLAYSQRGPTDEDEPLRGGALAAALLTLERMSAGGIHDHVGGGFHRYSTDERWLVPHFEKMLSDNALLLGNYAEAARIVGSGDVGFTAMARRTADGIVSWLDRDLALEGGLYASALDADSEGVEGKTYVWTADEIRIVLGEDAKECLSAYGIEEGGNFADEATGRRTGANIPHLGEDANPATQETLARLLAARGLRVQPGRDDKALVGWNGLAIVALAAAGRRERAIRIADAILAYEPLPRHILHGKPTGQAYLDDHAYLIYGLLALGTPAHRQAAERLCREMVTRFYDESDGGFWATSDAHEGLFGRTKPVFDQPIPSGNAMAIRCLIALGDLERAGKSLAAFAGWMDAAPQSCEGLLLAELEFRRLVSLAHVPTATRPEFSVGLTSAEIRIGDDGWAAGEVVLHIPDGWHVNSPTPPAQWLVPTEVKVEPFAFEISYPEPTQKGYVGRTRIPFRFVAPPDRDVAEFEVVVKWQACTDRECLAPSERRFACRASR